LDQASVVRFGISDPLRQIADPSFLWLLALALIVSARSIAAAFLANSG
jgi:hypothetical protein